MVKYVEFLRQMAFRGKIGEKDFQRKIWKVFLSPTWGTAPVESISSKFGSSLHPTNVIISSKCGTDWYCRFGSGEVQSLPSLIGIRTGPYHMQLLWACG